MDSFHYQQQQQQHDRRLLGQTIAGGDRDHQWYPSPSRPPPPPPGGYFNHPPPPQQPHGYHHHPPPPPPHFQQQQQHHPTGMGPPPHQLAPPPPYHGQPPPYPHHSQYPPPPLPWPHHSMGMPHHLPPPPPSAYPPPPNQAWGNPSWASHQGWEYPERNVPYNNEEDWAARAKAWAAAKSGTENHHTQSHFTPVGRTDEHGYPYHYQYQQAVGPSCDGQQPSFPQSSNQHFSVRTMDPLRQANHLHGSTSFSSGSSSYGTGYNVGDEAPKTNADLIASPQKSYGPGASAYEQEVSYSYSSAPGDREVVHQIEGLHVPLPLPVSSLQEGHHSQPTLPTQMTPPEQPHFSNHRVPTDFFPDACDRPLEFERRHDSNHQSYQKINFGHTGPTVAVGVMEHDPAASSILSWTPTAPGVGFPQIPLGPSGAQFDPTFIPQASVPVPSPVFEGITATSFQPSMPPVSAPYALGPASSLHAAAFSGDFNGALNLPERPKKAAVPNWLREEIIKNKSVLPSATQPTGDSFDSVGPEDGDKSLRRDDHGDSKSIDSTRSSENEEDDEEDVEATRLAAINQEIKRVLTEVLLKVTDELFDEIATKVLNEEEQSIDAEEPTTNGNRRVSPSTAISTPKSSAKVLVPQKMETNKVDHVGENSSKSSAGGNILGLANYASDDDDDGDNDEMRSTKLPSSGKKTSALHDQESNDNPSENNSESVKDKADNRGIASKHEALGREENHMMKKGSLPVDNLYYTDRASEGLSTVYEESIPVDSRKVEELPSECAISKQSMGIVGAKANKVQQSTSGYVKNDKALANDNQDRESRRDKGSSKNLQNKIDNKVSMGKTSCETSDGSDPLIHEDKNRIKEKMDKREKLKEKVDDRSSTRHSNLKESDSRRSSKHNSVKDDKEESTKDKREKYKEDGGRKRERTRDEKGNRSTSATKDSSRYSSRSPSPSSRGKNIRDNSFSQGSASGDEPSDNSRKRKKLSRNNSLSTSPTKPRKRLYSTTWDKMGGEKRVMVNL